jgi:hypothetical protein
MKKTRSRKSRDTVPLTTALCMVILAYKGRLLIHFITNLSLVQISEGRCKAVRGLEGDKETS